MPNLFNDIGENKHTRGECPVDKTPTAYLTFSSSTPDITLTPAWAPFVIKTCPLCLASSAEHDFHSLTVRQSGTNSLSELIRSPYSGLRKDFARSVGLRLCLAKKYFAELSDVEIKTLLDSREPEVSKNIAGFIRSIAPALPEDNTLKIVEHLKTTLVSGKDPSPFLEKLSGAADSGNIAQETPAARLIAMGADLGVLTQAALYGPLIASFDDKLIARLTGTGSSTAAAYAEIIMLQLHLDRFSIYLHLISQKDRLRSLVDENNRMYEDPDFLEEAVEQYIRTELSQKSQKGYILLALGRNYFRTAFFLINHRSLPFAKHSEARLPELLEKAICFLELSLLTEQYPEFDNNEKIMMLHKRFRVVVPYFFGEFGVRYLLCCLHNELGKLRKEEAGIASEGAGECGKAIVRHWTHIHSKFKIFDFGQMNDPDAVKILIPRMIAFVSQCFHPISKEKLEKALAGNKEKLYARYCDEAEALRIQQYS